MDTIIKRLRNARGYTQYDVADKANISIRQYQRYETGKVKPPIDKAIRLAQLFNAPVERLFK